ncbi:holdfast anchor protein HfaD [Brevundimonas sp.]|uniref:holdfast anchor protein HfaD n=1 Tax=Brevundimonas sp. TaxID=1871086 RepID=UPI0028A1498A|nr:holdfast anchor protein HfaD [Brevundimonas sp.]
MVRHARIRLAGTIAATAMCAAAVTEAAAQDRGLVLNQQLQLGDVVAGQTLNVVDVSDQVTVSTASQGNGAIMGGDGRDFEVRSTQDMRGDASASTSLTLGGETNGLTTSVTQARGNYLAGTASRGQMALDATQTLSGDVTASTVITGQDAQMVGGGQVAAAALGNTVALAGNGSGSDRAALVGSIDQTTTGLVRANNTASPRFVREPADFSTQAVANAVQATSGPSANQELGVRQRSSGALVEADTGAYAGNGWNLAARAHAGGNQAGFYNQGGSLVPTTDQANTAFIRSEAELSSYDFGKATAAATAIANEVTVGNNDIFVDIDNTQLNSGGVEATASFVGQKGYDAYVGANAAGNSVTGYACAECVGDLNARNVQTNSGNVSAMATSTINGNGRNVIAGANAVGNTASFYVTQTGGN